MQESFGYSQMVGPIWRILQIYGYYLRLLFFVEWMGDSGVMQEGFGYSQMVCPIWLILQMYTYYLRFVFYLHTATVLRGGVGVGRGSVKDIWLCESAECTLWKENM